jgi:RND family efflux transporter MFP subunit
VREGDAVRAGDVLASIDRQSLDESTRTAAAALEKARQDEQVRVEAAALTAQLLEKGIASREERDADRAALEATRAGRVEAEARLTQARRQGEWSELRAPFSGVVAAVMKHPGELVDGTAATAVLRLLGTSVEEVSADATASDLARLATGQPATVSLPGRDQPLAGTVSRVARAVDPATGVGELRVRLAARSGAPLLSTVSVSIVVARHPDALAVPLAALRRAEGGGEQVVRLEGGKAHVVEVRTGARSDRLVEIVEGLKGGESVVVDSPLGLAPDTPLRIRTPANAEAAR